MIWDNFSILKKHIAPSPAAHTRACCEDFWACGAGEMASEIPENFFRGMPVAGHGKFSVGLLFFRRRKTANLIDS